MLKKRYKKAIFLKIKKSTAFICVQLKLFCQVPSCPRKILHCEYILFALSLPLCVSDRQILPGTFLLTRKLPTLTSISSHFTGKNTKCRIGCLYYENTHQAIIRTISMTYNQIKVALPATRNFLVMTFLALFSSVYIS